MDNEFETLNLTNTNENLNTSIQNPFGGKGHEDVSSHGKAIFGQSTHNTNKKQPLRNSIDNRDEPVHRNQDQGNSNISNNQWGQGGNNSTVQQPFYTNLGRKLSFKCKQC